MVQDATGLSTARIFDANGGLSRCAVAARRLFKPPLFAEPSLANELSIAHLVMGAGPVVKTVMVILLGASVASWTIMLRKRRILAVDRQPAGVRDA